MLAVRSPHQVADVGVVALCSLDSSFRRGFVKINLVLSGDIADVGDVLAVRTPCRSPFVCSGSLGDVPGDSLAHRHVEDLTTGRHGCPLSVRRDAESTALHLLQFGT